MNAHLYTTDGPATGPCTVCGKTRNTKAHKEAKAQVAAVDAATDDEATTVAEAREDLLPEVNDAVDDAEIADALEAAGITVEEQVEIDEAKQQDEQVEAEVEAEAPKPAPAKKAPAKKATTKKADAPVASVWVGWRITNAAVLTKTSLGAKLKAAKPTNDLDRTVKLTVEELRQLDALAQSFMTEGRSGPEVYSGRALRGRVAAALAKLGAEVEQ